VSTSSSLVVVAAPGMQYTLEQIMGLYGIILYDVILVGMVIILFIQMYLSLPLSLSPVSPSFLSLPLLSHRSMLPVGPTVGPTISLELDVDDGEVENYEVS
jgi:hypothetical protein